MKIELTEEQLQNLSGFLSRAQLQGNEVQKYIELMQILQTASQRPQEEE